MGITVCFQNGTTLNPVTRIYDDQGALQYYPSPYCESFMQIILNIMLAMNIWSANRLEIVLSLISLRNWI